MPVKSTNVLIFGETGAGKSSVVNAVNGADVAAVSQDANGCTFQSTPYEVKIEGATYNLYDTAGLNEAHKGTVDGPQALSNLYALVRSLWDAGGIHLLVLVMKSGRITDNVDKNYRLFYDTFCEKGVPVVIILTHCENVEPKMDDWWTKNENKFEPYGMAFEGHACVCTAKGRKQPNGTHVNDELFNDSKDSMRALIHAHSLKANGWKKETFKEWLQNILNGIQKFLGLEDTLFDKLVSQFNRTDKEIMRLGKGFT